METGESDIPLEPQELLLGIYLLPLWVRGISWNVQIQKMCEYVFSTCNSWSENIGIKLVTGGIHHSFTITIILWNAANSSLYQRSLTGMVATSGQSQLNWRSKSLMLFFGPLFWSDPSSFLGLPIDFSSACLQTAKLCRLLSLLWSTRNRSVEFKMACFAFIQKLNDVKCVFSRWRWRQAEMLVSIPSAFCISRDEVVKMVLFSLWCWEAVPLLGG